MLINGGASSNSSSLLGIGVQGMQRSYANMSADANNVVRSGTLDAENADLGDMTTSMVDMDFQHHLFDASAKVVKTANDLIGTLINISA